jgi:hypothetical protein
MRLSSLQFLLSRDVSPIAWYKKRRQVKAMEARLYILIACHEIIVARYPRHDPSAVRRLYAI